MDDLELEPLGEDMFLNTERRCPVVLLQDTSSSMRPVIDQVNQGLQDMKAELALDPLASQRVEIAIVTFGPVALVQDFVTVDQWFPPRLKSGGNTPLGGATRFALDQLRLRKSAYREAGVPYYRPWIWLVTDGAPTDDWREAVDEAQAEVRRGGLELFTVGTENADFNVLRQISSPRAPVRLRQARYRDMFVWLSQSLRPVSKSEPGSALNLPSPAAWGEIET
ncbi:MAG: VWA domain-containing protein [Fimbriimonadaceae bacterium]|nr:VWA domain-containing protein [Fimbriimonadaceae bacterium]